MKIAIAGYGAEGRANFDYWHRPGNELTIVDEREAIDDAPAGAATMLGAGAFGQLQGFDVVVRTAGLAPRKIVTDGQVWSATNEFFAQCPAPIIGVTGTKGKGTTSSLMVSILRAAGKTEHLVGNIGAPALAELANIQPSDIVVYELSSFQLWDARASPHIAVVLGIEPDHLDVHESFEEYVAAKGNIARFQAPSDVVIYNQNNTYAYQIAQLSPGQKIAYPFAIDEYAASLKLPGAHNRENAAAAIAATRQFGVDDDAIRQGLASFTGLPHRLKFIREVDSIRLYDDNYSTTPSSTLAAVKAFSVPEILIAGGYDKGVDMSEFAAELSRVSNLSHIILIGQTGPQLRDLLADHGYHTVTLLEGKPSMSEIVSTAIQQANDGDVVVMSPAYASFDMFKNVIDRGDQFVAAVEAL